MFIFNFPQQSNTVGLSTAKVVKMQSAVALKRSKNTGPDKFFTL